MGFDTVVPIRAGELDAGLTIAAGGTAEVALAAQTDRTYLEIQNPSTATEVLYFRTDGTAAADKTSRSLGIGESWWNPPGACPTGAVSVFAATTGHVVVCKYMRGNRP